MLNNSIGCLPTYMRVVLNNSIGSTFYSGSIANKSWLLCYCILYCLSCAALMSLMSRKLCLHCLKEYAEKP